MKVLQINNYDYIRGGSDRVFLETDALLRKEGHTSVRFASSIGIIEDRASKQFYPEGIPISSQHISNAKRFIYNSEAARCLERLLEMHGPFDVAHLHIYYGQLTPSILGVLKRAGIPIVQTLHEYKLACPVYTMERNGQTCEACVSGSTLNVLRHRCKNGSLAQSMAMLAEFWTSRAQGDVRLIDRFLCVSDFQRSLLNRAGIPGVKLRRLHNFVDTESLRPIPFEQKGDYLLYFGRIEKLKGLPTLIRAAVETGKRLKIAGTGTWLDGMKAEIAGRKNIEYLGFHAGAELQDLISRAKAVLVPSEWYENCPMTVLEAKAVGTPVIGSNIGGIPELIRDGVDGFLFEPGDPVALAEAIGGLENADLRAFSAAARADACARFSPDIYLQQLLTIYGEAQKL